MTANQIAYARVQEDRRHNKETEAQNLHSLEIGERNAIAQHLGAMAAQSQAETARMRASEEVRANKIRESLQTQQNAETVRSNMARESENTRANKAREVETLRSNLASEKLKSEEIAVGRRRADVEASKVGALYQQAAASLQQAEAAKRNADSNAQNALNAFGQLMELRSHNTVMEEIGAQQAETERMKAISGQAQARLANAQANRIIDLQGSEKFKNYASILTPLGLTIMKGLS